MDYINVSVIVPIYNTQDYLCKCIDSILSQTYRNFELILVDDGSTDECPAICDRYGLADDRITVIHKQNGGLASARNAGLEAAGGKYISFVDSDDYIAPNLLETVVAVMEKHSCDWAGFGMIKEDPNGALIERIGFKPCEVCVLSEEDRMEFLLKYLLNYRTGWEACSHVFRGDIIRENHLRFVSERVVFAEDMLFSFMYWLYAKSCVVIEDQLYHYIQRRESLMGESKRRNVIPQIHSLAQEAYRAAVGAGLTYIQMHFEIIYLHFMEWQIRPYVAERGIDWVRAELEKIELPQYLPKERSAFQKVYCDRVKQFGRLDGFATVVLPVFTEASASQVEAYINKLLSKQTLRKLDILILCQKELHLSCKDIRVRQLCTERFEVRDIIRTAFCESNGEYLYFADCSHPIAARFLEQMCDILKYNVCSTVISAGEPLGFLDMGSLADRQRLRGFLHTNHAFALDTVFRSDLLEASGLACMEDLQEYLPDIILSGHTMIIRRE